MNILRHPQESFVNTFEKLRALNFFRIKIKMIVHTIFPLVLLTGFFTAGTNAGISCNTFPWVGDHWFYTKNHFLSSE
jgi:heme A synthase